jgi:outer membrane lipoprotein carrier protein
MAFFRWLAVVATLAAAWPAAGEPAAPALAPDSAAEDLAAQLQKRYREVRDFSADFVHVYEGGVLRKQLTERGHLLIKKPGMMRWEYTTPERKLFVSDGVKLYSYIPEDQQVIISSVPKQDEATTPALFLTGKGDLTRDFTPSIVEPPPGVPGGTWALKLVPKTRQPEYDWLILAVEPGSMTIRGLVTVDAQGGRSTFSFSNLKENISLSDKEFTFKIPRGVDVVTQPARP